MEEDTAKQFHFDDYSLIDYNRSGIPLIEIVTRPTIRSAQGAAAYLERLRQILLFTDVSDAKMEEGSMRCDVNVSIRPYGSDRFGTRCEIKNLNSISNVQKAIEYEVARQKKIILSGGLVTQNTMRYDEDLKQTVVMRAKGDAVDYKYYPEPNILPIRLDHAWVESIKANLPEMPDVLVKRYVEEYQIPKTDALILVQTKPTADFFNETIRHTTEYKQVANWLLGEVAAYLNKNKLTITATKLTPVNLGALINLINDATISSKQAKDVFAITIEEGQDPNVIIEEKNMKQISSVEVLSDYINGILDKNPQSIDDYAAGKNRAVGFIVGQLMKATNGQANPAVANKLVVELLKKRC